MAITKNIFEKKWNFFAGVGNINQIPPKRNPEVAFIGASNAGKSTIINRLVGQKIAVTSSTPGRTQQLNFFSIDSEDPNQLIIVDMPGYGYAKASKKSISHWQKVAIEYLTNRINLKRVFVLVDPIRGLKESDFELFNSLSAVGASFQIILTKIDKTTREELAISEAKINKQIANFASLYPKILKTSALRGDGISELQSAIIEILTF